MITLYGDHVIKLDSGPRISIVMNGLHGIQCKCYCDSDIKIPHSPLTAINIHNNTKHKLLTQQSFVFIIIFPNGERKVNKNAFQ